MATAAEVKPVAMAAVKEVSRRWGRLGGDGGGEGGGDNGGDGGGGDGGGPMVTAKPQLLRPSISDDS